MIELRVEPGLDAAVGLLAVKQLAWEHPGEHELTILVGQRRLKLGEAWTYSGDEACIAALSEFGSPALR